MRTDERSIVTNFNITSPPGQAVFDSRVIVDYLETLDGRGI